MKVTIRSADGTTLAARRSGSGSPLVLVHGGNGDLDTFALVEPLLAECHTVWTYSRRGRGGSGDGPDYCGDREIEDLCAVVDAAGGDAHVVAHSSGATIALLAAPRLPDIRSLTLYEPPLRIEGVDAETVMAIARELEADVETGLELFLPVAGITYEEVAVVRSMPKVWDRMLAGARLAPREIRAALAEADRLTTMEQPGVPTLYLHGEETESPWFLDPADVPGRLPAAEIRGIPSQRHLAFAFAPERFAAEVLSFTASVDRVPVP
ncbi:MAG TPA: alpha/beta hydrolase [Acidimicrobiales bacterium]|nr:alpha/beta hydrolase [Acidimicrobiales bacterium]